MFWGLSPYNHFMKQLQKKKKKKKKIKIKLIIKGKPLLKDVDLIMISSPSRTLKRAAFFIFVVYKYTEAGLCFSHCGLAGLLVG